MDRDCGTRDGCSATDDATTFKFLNRMAISEQNRHIRYGRAPEMVPAHGFFVSCAKC